MLQFLFVPQDKQDFLLLLVLGFCNIIQPRPSLAGFTTVCSIIPTTLLVVILYDKLRFSRSGFCSRVNAMAGNGRAMGSYSFCSRVFKLLCIVAVIGHGCNR